MAVEVLSGWGRTAPTAAHVVRPTRAEMIPSLVADAGPRGVLARGLGRSYGDPAQNAGGVVLDMTGLDHLMSLDPSTASLKVSAGTSFDTIMRALVPRGWFVPVTPGTRFVTVGGAIAADIHGKNHHVDGSFGNHISALTLATPAGTFTLSSGTDAELFWATVGGMGLTGVIIDATFTLLPIETSWMRVESQRCHDLDDVMERMETEDQHYRYSVAWIDCRATGRALGRSVLTRGDHARVDDLLPRYRAEPLAFEPRVRFRVPEALDVGVVNNWSVTALNELWYRRAPAVRRTTLEPLASFFHPLDALGHWNRLYGRRGLLQYQFVVPGTAGPILHTVIGRLSAAGVGSSLAVLKRFGPGNRAPLSFPGEGWTLALDIPAGRAEVAALLDELDVMVATAGGRLYLAKDSRMRAALVPAMYPNVAAWREARQRVDPHGLLRSDLARRLALV